MRRPGETRREGLKNSGTVLSTAVSSIVPRIRTQREPAKTEIHTAQLAGWKGIGVPGKAERWRQERPGHRKLRDGASTFIADAQ